MSVTLILPHQRSRKAMILGEGTQHVAGANFFLAAADDLQGDHGRDKRPCRNPSRAPLNDCHCAGACVIASIWATRAISSRLARFITKPSSPARPVRADAVDVHLRFVAQPSDVSSLRGCSRRRSSQTRTRCADPLPDPLPSSCLHRHDTHSMFASQVLGLARWRAVLSLCRHPSLTPLFGIVVFATRVLVAIFRLRSCWNSHTLLSGRRFGSHCLTDVSSPAHRPRR